MMINYKKDMSIEPEVCPGRMVDMSAEYCHDYVTTCLINEIVLEQQLDHRYKDKIDSLTGLVDMMKNRIEMQDNLIKELKTTIKQLTARKGLRRII